MATASPKDPPWVPPAEEEHEGKHDEQEQQKEGEAETADERTRPARKSKFRFKSKKSRRSEHASDSGVRKRRRAGEDLGSESKSGSHRSHRHYRGRQSESRRGRSESEDMAAWAAEAEEAAAGTGFEQQDPQLTPQQAFQESLFDALADDEGAAYWEGVYGQPIHNYPNVKVGPKGELERMTDEEYAAYVRARMYEKTHQHIAEERKKAAEAKAEAKKKQQRLDEEGRRLEEEHMAFEQKIQESLRRGEERKAKKQYKAAWELYNARWEKLREGLNASSSTRDGDGSSFHKLVPWPVLTGRRADVSKDAVEHFFRNAPPEISFQQLLKAERIKWHPDKMQQRLGGQGLDGETLQSVTAVFQILDDMWTSFRKAHGDT